VTPPFDPQAVVIAALLTLVFAPLIERMLDDWFPEE